MDFYAIEYAFQFLIGRLATKNQKNHTETGARQFQFLIGRLATKMAPGLSTTGQNSFNSS